MLNRVEAYIRKEGLLNKEGLYIVALSGGADIGYISTLVPMLPYIN